MKDGYLKVFLIVGLFVLPCWGQEWRPHGAGPIKIKEDSWEHIGAKSCQACHAPQFQDWQRSKHAQSWNNHLFQKNFNHEGNPRCLNCHAPFEMQIRSMEGQNFAPAMEGVTCYTCHSSAHGKTEISKFKSNDPRFCAQCHQFNFAVDRGHQVRSSPTVSQNTFREWESYRKNGGTKTCIDCHMPKKSHEFHGAYSLEFLRKGLTLKIKKSFKGCEVALRNAEAGHHIPTGDLFREIRFEVSEQNHFKNSKILRRFSRRWVQVKEESIVVLKEAANTTLAPFAEEKIWIKKTRGAKLFYRLVYHYTLPRYEALFQVSQTPFVIYQGVC